MAFSLVSPREQAADHATPSRLMPANRARAWEAPIITAIRNADPGRQVMLGVFVQSDHTLVPESERWRPCGLDPADRSGESAGSGWRRGAGGGTDAVTVGGRGGQ